jgi:hypothetical protein
MTTNHTRRTAAPWYSDHGETETLFQMEQTDFDTTIGLATPDKTVPACETTAMPPFGGGVV